MILSRDRKELRCRTSITDDRMRGDTHVAAASVVAPSGISLDTRDEETGECADEETGSAASAGSNGV